MVKQTEHEALNKRRREYIQDYDPEAALVEFRHKYSEPYEILTRYEHTTHGYHIIYTAFLNEYPIDEISHYYDL